MNNSRIYFSSPLLWIPNSYIQLYLISLSRYLINGFKWKCSSQMSYLFLPKHAPSMVFSNLGNGIPILPVAQTILLVSFDSSFSLMIYLYFSRIEFNHHLHLHYQRTSPNYHFLKIVIVFWVSYVQFCHPPQANFKTKISVSFKDLLDHVSTLLKLLHFIWSKGESPYNGPQLQSGADSAYIWGLELLRPANGLDVVRLGKESNQTWQMTP